jgi:hypothetical protein
MRAPATLLLAALIFSCAANAKDNMTGTDLYQLCNSNTKTANEWCSIYIAGILAGIVLATDKRLPAICVPDKVVGIQAELIVKKYMRERPENLNLPAHAIVYSALGRAFPCVPPRSN